MKAARNILSLQVDIPQSEVSVFESLTKKRGWKISSEKQELEKTIEEKELFFTNSKRSMVKHIEKYLSE